MRLSNLKADRGVAGTTVLLGLIVSLFVIGLLVMIFALMGGALQNSSYNVDSVVNESSDTSGIKVVSANSTGYTLAEVTDNNALNCVVNTIWSEYYQSNGSATTVGTHAGFNTSIDLTNVSLSSAGVLTNGTATYEFPNVSASYVCDAPNTATNVIGNTTTSISSVTDFFSLFIVIGSMVVLILLTVIIIVAIRQSGLLEGGTA